MSDEKTFKLPFNLQVSVKKKNIFNKEALKNSLKSASSYVASSDLKKTMGVKEEGIQEMWPGLTAPMMHTTQSVGALLTKHDPADLFKRDKFAKNAIKSHVQTHGIDKTHEHLQSLGVHPDRSAAAIQLSFKKNLKESAIKWLSENEKLDEKVKHRLRDYVGLGVKSVVGGGLGAAIGAAAAPMVTGDPLTSLGIGATLGGVAGVAGAISSFRRGLKVRQALANRQTAKR